MFSRLCALLGFVLLLTGCNQVRTIQLSPTHQTTFSEINQSEAHRVAEVRMDDGQTIKATYVQMAPDSTSWFNQDQNAWEYVPTREIRTITFYRTLKGALTGLGVAVGAGIAAGVTRALVEGDDPPTESIPLSRDRKMFVYSLGFTTYTSVITIPLGAIIGNRNTYRVRQAARPSTLEAPSSR